MISVLIPVYNYPVEDLVQTLLQQGQEIDEKFEIIILEDGSTTHLRENRELEKLKGVSIFLSEKNMGRSKARNHLAQRAAHELLLFLDCDGIPVSTSFLKEYLRTAAKGKVIVGGTNYENSKSREHGLHHLYGVKREQNSRGFQSNNFAIFKTDFQRVGGFDESLIQYGHEDTLFGVELRRKGIAVKKVDNPVYHIGLETNREFVEKSLKAVENAYELFKAGKISASDIRLLDFYLNWEKSPLKRSVLKAICQKRRRWMNVCLSENPRLFALDFLKLCRLRELNRAD